MADGRHLENRYDVIIQRWMFRFGRNSVAKFHRYISIDGWDILLVSKYKHSVKVAYVDFSKASDSVSHEKLFVRIASYGIRGNSLQWLREYFSERTHQTRVGFSLSAVIDLLSGVVQGSGIGPSFFPTLMNWLKYWNALVLQLNYLPMTSNYIWRLLMTVMRPNYRML